MGKVPELGPPVELASISDRGRATAQYSGCTLNLIEFKGPLRHADGGDYNSVH
jgi:hypothetical protein